MARLVVHTAKGPKKVKGDNKDLWMCMCGLSKKKPFCDASHSKIKDEGEAMACHDENGEKLSFEMSNDESESCAKEEKNGCCGGGCSN